VRLREAVLALSFFEVFGGVDEEQRLLALLEHKDADGE